MAFFKDTKKKDTSKAAQAKGAESQETKDLLRKNLNRFNADEVIKAPRVTEKAALQTQNNVYVFEVDQRSSKRDIRYAIKTIYNVTPQKIRVAYIPRKEVDRRARGRGFTARGKKAYVYLKEGDSIAVI